MFEEISHAIQNKDYNQASRLIKKLRLTNAKNPWLDFYTAQLYEVKGKQKEAKKVYNYLLKNIINPQLTRKIRQRLEAIKQEKIAKKENAIALAKSQIGEEKGLFILEAIPKEKKQIASQRFGKIMEIDAYTARLQIPSRSWRLYRIGNIGEFSYYVKVLNKAGIPCFCIPISKLKKLSVSQIKYIETVTSKVKVICENSEGKEERLTFHWSEISKRVEALVPIFTQSFQFGVNREIYNTQEFLDYNQLCDLYLPKRKKILRFCDQQYNFKKGINFFDNYELDNSLNQTITTRQNWNQFLKFIQQQLPNIPIYSEFNFFGETALDYKEFLKEINPNINVFRQQPSLWDQAFHLYSNLAFLKP